MVDSGLSNTAAAAAAGSIADAAAAAAAGRAGAVSPVVVDLGCGFGVGLLSLVQPSSPVLPSPVVQPSTAVNVLGCDACALKVGYLALGLVPQPYPNPNLNPGLTPTLTLALALA